MPVSRVVRKGAVLRAGLVLASLVFPAFAGKAAAQEQPATIDTTLEAGEADAEVPRRRFLRWNEYDGPVTTFNFGLGFAYDLVGYEQDEESKQQFDLEPDHGLRDFRFLFRGRFKTARPLSWTMGYMYDGNEEEWRFRQTGITVGVPEVSGSFFVGRTKEGYSAVKVMTGYYIWTPERSQTLDAFVPILGDGIKYMGYYEAPRVFLNLGWFGDMLSENEKFAIYDRQMVARLGWQPILSEEDEEVLHVAVMGRDAKADDGKLRMKSKPAAYLAPNFLDSGSFAADDAHTLGAELFWRKGPWMLAAEYDWQDVHALDGSQPTYHGGDVAVVWNITGETRPYNAKGAFFGATSPKRTVFEGGPGGWEATLHLSFNDFDSGTPYDGGKFWRLTPMTVWHLSDALHLHMAYGYSKTDRFGLKGATQFFQSRFLFYF